MHLDTERRVCNADGTTFSTTTCPSGQTCSGGACAAAPGCPAGQTLCGAVCVDLLRDAANCGRCANACPAGAACGAGTCAVATAPMITARAAHALVTLPDGRVLAIGGLGEGRVHLRAVERYDPATNRWEARAPLLDALGNAYAALLEDGRVVASGPLQSSLQVYTPSTDTWARLTTFPGPVGYYPQIAHATRERVYVFDSYQMHSYELATRTWRAGPSLIGATGGTSFAVDATGAIHVFNTSDRMRRAVYSTVTNEWTLVPNASFGNNSERVVFGPDGFFYGAGAYDPATMSSLNRFARFDPVRNAVTPLAPMQFNRTGTKITVLPGGRLLVCGGQRIQGDPGAPEYLNTAEIYTIATNTWR
jgi:hypothetical protein